jgi:PAS domain S-box-containing protein
MRRLLSPWRWLEATARHGPISPLAGAVTALGAVVLYGWAADIDWLLELAPGWALMQPWTAFCFVLGGVALQLHTRRQFHSVAPLVVVMALLATSSLLQHVIDHPLGIDTLLFHDAVLAQDRNPHPGRMAQVVAMEFLLLCLCLALPRRTRWLYRLVGRVATLGLVIALVGMAGYVLGSHRLAQLGSFAAMAAHTALGFALLFGGVLLAQRDSNWLRFLFSPAPGAGIARTLLPYILGWPLAVGFVIPILDPYLKTPHLDLAVALVLVMIILVTLVLRIASRIGRAERARMIALMAQTASEARLTSIVGSAMDAIITIDKQQRIVLFNTAAERLFGCTAAEAIGTPIERFIPARYRSAHAEYVLHFGETGTTSRAMGRLGALSGMRSDGSEFPIEASISQVEIEGRKFFTVILRDIGERVRAEAEIRRLNADLERRVERRTAELARANEALLKSNLDLQQFAHIAAHDLQTPLRSISGFAQLLRQDCQGKCGERSDLYVQHLVGNTQRMQTLIQDLLAYAQLGAAARPFEPVDCRKVFDDVLDALAASITDNGAEVSRGELPVVMGERTMLTQLLQNLIDNAIKYHSELPPQVCVVAERQGAEWVFSVSDNGIGIAPKHQERIFEVFRRLHTPQAYPGTGIGLAICRRVVEHHGGRIWVESEPGKGSVFKFTLPQEALA